MITFFQYEDDSPILNDEEHRGHFAPSAWTAMSWRGDTHYIQFEKNLNVETALQLRTSTLQLPTKKNINSPTLNDEQHQFLNSQRQRSSWSFFFPSAWTATSWKGEHASYSIYKESQCGKLYFIVHHLEINSRFQKIKVFVDFFVRKAS